MSACIQGLAAGYSSLSVMRAASKSNAISAGADVKHGSQASLRRAERAFL
jgi:hypothetical protein